MMASPALNETRFVTIPRPPVVAQGLLSDVLIATPVAAAAPARGSEGAVAQGPNGVANGQSPVIASLQERLQVLAASCADALDKAIQHLEGEDAWVIGALPNCGPLADEVEASARAVLAQSHLNTQELDEVTEVLKSAGDLRAAARGARQAVQLAHLIRQDAAGREAVGTVRALGSEALLLALGTSNALATNDPVAARHTALRFRSLDAARRQGEKELRSPHGAALFAPTVVRMVRASLWHLAVAGESMARVAARVAAKPH